MSEVVNERMDAIEHEGEKQVRGQGKAFYFVDRDAAERCGIEQYKPKVDTNFTTILPPRDKKQFYARVVMRHDDVGVNEETFLCMRETIDLTTGKPMGKPCACCEKRERVAERSPESPLVKSLMPGERYLFLLKDTSTLAANATEQEMANSGSKTLWYDASPTWKRGITEVSRDPRTRKFTIDVSNPDTGQTVIFTRNGTGQQTKWESFKLETRAPIPDCCLFIPEYDELLLFPDYEMVKLAAEGIPPAASEESTGRNRGRGETSDTKVNEDGIRTDAAAATTADARPARNRPAAAESTAAEPTQAADSAPETTARNRPADTAPANTEPGQSGDAAMDAIRQNVKAARGR